MDDNQYGAIVAGMKALSSDLDGIKKMQAQIMSEIARYRRFALATLQSTGNFHWCLGYIRGISVKENFGKGVEQPRASRYIAVYPASPHAVKRVCRIWEDEFERIEQEFPGLFDLSFGVNDDNLVTGKAGPGERDEEIAAGRFYLTPKAFSIATYPGKDTQMGPEVRFGMVVETWDTQSAFFKALANNPQVVKPWANAPAQRPARRPPAKKELNGKSPEEKYLESTSPDDIGWFLDTHYDWNPLASREAVEYFIDQVAAGFVYKPRNLTALRAAFDTYCKEIGGVNGNPTKEAKFDALGKAAVTYQEVMSA